MAGRDGVWLQLLAMVVGAYILSAAAVGLMLGWHRRAAAHLVRWRLWWTGRQARREPSRAALMQEFASWDEERRRREAGQPHVRAELPRSGSRPLALPPGRPRP